MTEPVTVLITSYNRPLYLWACLDSLYRNTRHPHHFTMLDMASEDRLVGQVIAGFERRGMFSQVIWAPRNHLEELWKVIWSLVDGAGEFFAYVDGDVVVEDRDPCWLGAFVALMEQHPRLAMVGPAIDKRDFISWERARALEPGLEEQQLAGLIKLHSPERNQDLNGLNAHDLAYPHNPPGRLLLLRGAALAGVGAGTDGELDRRFRDAGYETGIATGVRHRHLSLLNLFDYPGYDMTRRDEFYRSTGSPGLTPKR
ncbi:MAG: glycosyltransferase family 2 protein [Gammaproteobacteria bacterium]|nr:glycosyltransferase family 2 protein [Gammaproteobacteria bacterium]MDH3413511.1 glycosyltransferase family 2 protein [Gammaproteobacteria bacterium]